MRAVYLRVPNRYGYGRSCLTSITAQSPERLAAYLCAALPSVGAEEAADSEVPEQDREKREHPKMVGRQRARRSVQVRPLTPGCRAHGAGNQGKKGACDPQPKGSGEHRQRLPHGAFEMPCTATQIPACCRVGFRIMGCRAGQYLTRGSDSAALPGFCCGRESRGIPWSTTRSTVLPCRRSSRLGYRGNRFCQMTRAIPQRSTEANFVHHLSVTRACAKCVSLVRQAASYGDNHEMARGNSYSPRGEEEWTNEEGNLDHRRLVCSGSRVSGSRAKAAGQAGGRSGAPPGRGLGGSSHPRVIRYGSRRRIGAPIAKSVT